MGTDTSPQRAPVPNTSAQYLNQPYQAQSNPHLRFQLQQFSQIPTSTMVNTPDFQSYFIPPDYSSVLPNPTVPNIFQTQNQLAQSGNAMAPPTTSSLLKLTNQNEMKKVNHLAYPLTIAPNVSYSPIIVTNPFSEGNSVNSDSKGSDVDGSNSSLHHSISAEPNHISYWK
jgi:hypothetical protein